MDLTLVFPSKTFGKQFGIGLDFGCSAIKIVYTETADNGKDVQLKFIKLSINDFEKAFDFVEEKCKNKLEPQSEVFVTGIGITVHLEELSKRLNVRLSVMPELTMDIGIQTLLNHQTWDSIFHPPSEEALDYGSKIARQWTGLTTMISGDVMRLWPYMKNVESHDELVRKYKMPEKLKFPFIMTLLGSCVLIVLVFEDGTYLWLSHNGLPGGRTFLGLTSLLTDVKDFDEMVDLASRGDHSKVDQLTSDLIGDRGDEQYQGVLEADVLINPFGHCHGKTKEDFKKEDLAAAVVCLVTTTAAQQTFSFAELYHVEQVFFWGSFACSQPYLRHQVEHAFAIRRFANTTDHQCDCRFLRHGAYIGALGAVWKNLEMKH